MLKIAYIDHYDSFSFNLIDWLVSNSTDCEVWRISHDDRESLVELEKSPIPLVISPGPGRPEDYSSTLAVVQKLYKKVPMLGVCLGHQIMAVMRGAEVVAAQNPHHGTRTQLEITENDKIFVGLQPLSVACYNSLVVAGGSLQKEDTVLAVNRYNEVQAVRFGDPKFKAYGLQFHPESFLTDDRQLFCKNIFESVLGKPIC